MEEYKDYITIGEMAEKLDVSKPRIHQLIDSIGAKDETVKSGRVSLISPDLADRIEKRQLAGKEHIVSNADRLKEALHKRIESYTEANDKLTQELTTAKSTIQTVSYANDMLKSSNKELNNRIVDLKEQLSSKDEQLKAKDEQISTANQLADQAQRLQAEAQSQQKLLDEHKGFWSRLFGN